MKKSVAIVLCVSLLLIIFSGCGAGETTTTPTQTEAVPHTLSVGYAKVDITPSENVPLWGASRPRQSTHVTEKLYATCVAFTDETNNTILLYTVDLLYIYSDPFAWAKKDISKATGIPVDQIQFGATHTHSAPHFIQADNDYMTQYRADLRKWIVEAAEQALADRKPAQMYFASTQTENLNFVRHYIMDDGSVIGDNFGVTTGKKYVGHAWDADNLMQMVKFTREGAKDVVIVNWQSHPHRSGGPDKTNITSDIIGVMREKVEAELGCCFAYYNGACGDINPTSRISGENVTKTYQEQGQALADYVIRAESAYTKAQSGSIKFQEDVYKGTPKEAGGAAPDINMYVFSIGDLAFATAPSETFSKTGIAIREGSPYKMTFVVSNANDFVSYIPTKDNFEYGGVISYEGSMCKYKPGTAEELSDLYVSMLKQMHNG